MWQALFEDCQRIRTENKKKEMHQKGRQPDALL
jgi:hypothetical protein